MEKHLRKNFLNKIFDVAVIIKGIDGVLEVIGGLLLFFANRNTLNQFLYFLTQHELIEDPRDIIANYLVNFAHHISLGTEIFIASYLIIHGIIKIFLVISLLKNKLWAYPTALIFFSVFILYEIYRYTITHSVILLVLMLFDILVTILVIGEYRKVRKSINTNFT